MKRFSLKKETQILRDIVVDYDCIVLIRNKRQLQHDVCTKSED